MEFETKPKISMKYPILQRLIDQNLATTNQGTLTLQTGKLPLKQLKVAQEMHHRICLTIPSKDRHSNPIPNAEKYEEMVKNHFSKWSGGFTTKRGKGGYCSQSNGLIEENIIEIEIWITEKQLIEHLDELETLMIKLLSEMDQETLMIVFNNCAALLEI